MVSRGRREVGQGAIMKLRIEQLDEDGNTVRVLYPEQPVDADLRARWVAFMASLGFTGNVLAEDAVKAGMLFAMSEVTRKLADHA